MFSFLQILFTCAIWCFAHAVDYCPPLGPVYEPPRNLSADASICLAAQNLTATLNQLLGSREASTSTFALNTTSFSIDLFSAHDHGSLFQYHFTASALNASSTKKVDENTVYRVGSISKIVTVLALLLQEGKVHFDDPITKFIPELARYAEEDNEDDEESETYDDLATTKWSQITVGALASQLSGIGRTYSFADVSSAADIVVSNFGFPALNSSEVPYCGRDASQSPCSRRDFLQGMNQRHPIYAPFTTPAYSNAAFEILGYVVENVTAHPYQVVVQKTIFDPLGLRHSSVSTPRNASVGVIPIGESDWDFDLGGGSAAGGIYMSTKDLSSIGRAILNSSLLRPAQTRGWLKPLTHTASLRESVGAPWEIYRVPGLTQDGRVIDLYTKNGAIGLYNSLIVLVPDYDIGLTLFSAGDGIPISILTQQTLETFIPVIEQVGKKQAADRYTGVYGVHSSNSSNPYTSSVEISVDRGPGLVIKHWISNNIDVLKGYEKQFGSESSYTDWRLYPTGLKTKTSRQRIVSYRAFFKSVPLNATSDESTAEKNDGQIFPHCASWAGIDGFVYGSIGVDDFVFHTDSFGNVESIEPRATRTRLNKRGSALESNATQCI